MTDLDPWLRFVLAVLATWRLTHLLAREDGPADLIYRLRAVLGDGTLGRLMDCFYCLSLWIAAPLAFLLASNPLDLLLAWLALSGAAVLLERIGGDPASQLSIEPTQEKDTRHGMLWSETGGASDNVPAADTSRRAGPEPTDRS